MSAVIDWLEKRKDVDIDRIALYGISFGGYIGTRIASEEKRLKACAVSTPIPDWGMWNMDILPEAVRNAPELIDALLEKWDTGFLSHYQLAVVERWLKSSLGVKSVVEGLKLYMDYKADVSRITCPVLCMVGDGEAPPFQKQARMAYDNIKSPKVYRSFTVEEGAMPIARQQTCGLLTRFCLTGWMKSSSSKK
jgi:pimeloyl-ACP methyl ester carboxylesterase